MADESRPRASSPPPHRGRVQAQGGGTEKSVPSAQDTPPTASDLLRLVESLWAQLTRAERLVRQEAYEQIREYIQTRPGHGGLHAQVTKTFPKPRPRGGIRI